MQQRRIDLGLCHTIDEEDQRGLMSFVHKYYSVIWRFIHTLFFNYGTYASSTAQSSHSRTHEPIKLGLRHLFINTTE